MRDDTIHQDDRKPYEAPVVRELGKVTEVTRGGGGPAGADPSGVSI